MKRYVLSLLAVVLAACSLAFCLPQKSNKSLVYVKFVGNVQIMSEVENESKWEKVNVPVTCDGGNGKASGIRIDDSKLTAGSPQKLNPEYVSVIAAESDHVEGSFYVLELQNGTIGAPGSYTIINCN